MPHYYKLYTRGMTITYFTGAIHIPNTSETGMIAQNIYDVLY